MIWALCLSYGSVSLAFRHDVSDQLQSMPIGLQFYNEDYLDLDLILVLIDFNLFQKQTKKGLY